MNIRPQNIAMFLMARLQEAHPQHATVAFGELLAGVTEVYETHVRFVQEFTRAEFDFIFDAKTGLYLTRLEGKHVDLMAALYHYWGGAPKSLYDASDAYVESGMGMLKSRAGHCIYHGKSFVVPPELKPVYRDIEVL
jgi:hypothetical protein